MAYYGAQYINAIGLHMIHAKRRAALLSMIDKAPKNSRGSVKHAWEQIDKARLLAGVDNEMAAFRAITAEEEAATAIIKEITSIGYNHSKQLRAYNHSHKAGIWHLLTVISKFMHETGSMRKFAVSEGDGDLKGKLTISFPSPIPADSGWISPVPPLNVSITSDDKRIGFTNQANKLASEKSSKNLIKFIEREANIRNELIYASPEGIPSVEKPPLEFIAEREKRVMVLTQAYLLISQYREKQLFVQQSLDAYIQMLGKTANDLHPAL